MDTTVESRGMSATTADRNTLDSRGTSATVGGMSKSSHAQSSIAMQCSWPQIEWLGTTCFDQFVYHFLILDMIHTSDIIKVYLSSTSVLPNKLPQIFNWCLR